MAGATAEEELEASRASGRNAAHDAAGKTGAGRRRWLGRGRRQHRYSERSRSGYSARSDSQGRVGALALARRYGTLAALTVFFVFPLLFMIVGAFKPDDRVLADGSGWKAFIPFDASLDNFRQAFERAEFGRLFFNSVLITTCIVLGGLVVNSLAGYALARVPFRGRRLLLGITVALAIIPFQAVAIPLLLMMARIEWLDTYHVQIVPFLASPFYIYLFYSFFLGIPRELEEAAQLDGAGPVTIFVRVVVPLARPAYATVAILSFLTSWGELLWPVLVTRGSDVRPLSQGITVFQTQPPIQWGDIMAFATMTTVPLLVLFVVFQRAFTQGIARTGLKG